MRLRAGGRRDEAQARRLADSPSPPVGKTTQEGKHVTTVSGLDPGETDLAALAALLKGKCGTGGTVKNGVIELQGDHLVAAESALKELAYKTKRG